MSIIIKSGSSGNLANVSSAGAVQVDGSAVVQPVSISGSIAVTGTFWQTTQPVSVAGSIPTTVQDGAGNPIGSQHLSGDYWLNVNTEFSVSQGTSAPKNIGIVGGQTNDPTPQYSYLPLGAGGRSVIIEGFAGGTAVPVLVSGSIAVTGTFWQATQPVSLSGVVATTQQGGTSGLTGDVQAKGIQGVNALMTQDFKDSGRTYITISADRIAGITTEALITSLNVNKGGSVTSGVTSYTVTAGKIFRITSFYVEVLNTTTVDNRVLVRARVNNGGVAVLASPVVLMNLASGPAALAAAGGSAFLSIPDGLEIPAGSGIGISQLCTVTTAGIVSVALVGYEY